MVINICVGSSCHLKGSYGVIDCFQKCITENHLEDQVKLKASFCMGHCAADGVTVKINDDFVDGITPENAEEKFKSCVLGALKKD